MPRPTKGARLWLRPAERDKSGNLVAAARWIIKDQGQQISTGCGEGDREEAERKLSGYILEKYAPPRPVRGKQLHEIQVAEVLKIYLDDVVPGHADPEQSAGRCLRLNEFFGAMTLDQINGKVCREYAASRVGKGKTTKGTTGGARRDLEALRAAINHHWKEGLHREKIRIVMPKKGKARQRWLTRLEFARLLRVCWSTREIVDGKPTKKRPLLHLCRFLLLGTYTGSRPGVVMTAAWDKGPGRSWVDTDMGRFYRLPDGDVETDKRNPPVKLAPGLLSHLRRWKKIDSGRGYVVTFNGRQVESVDIALARATTLAQLESGVVAYTMRHTCGSWLVAKGVSTRKVADFLGTSEQMVIEHYGHLAPDFQDEAASKIGRK